MRVLAAIVLLAAATMPVSAQDAADYLGGVGVWALASERLDAPGHTYDFDPDLFSVQRRGSTMQIRYRSADPEACRAAAAVGMWTVVDSRRSGRWTVSVSCTAQRVTADLNLSRSPAAYSVEHHRGGELIFSNSWRGR